VPGKLRKHTHSKKKQADDDAGKKTLDRVLSRAGLGSRTDARRWIAEGRVAVDGRKIQTPEAWVDPDRQRVTLDGQALRAARKIYMLLYKPKGYLTTYKDPEGRPTIYDLLTAERDGGHDKAHNNAPAWVFPAGRLDQDTSGLLILTNDTAFGDFITSPESHVPKTYLVKASVLLTDQQLDQLRAGIVLADGPTRPAAVERIRDSERYTFFEITLTEGRNRQVRRMVEALGTKGNQAAKDNQVKVLKLVRTRIGAIQIGDLQIGKHRPLTPAEVHLLRTGRRRTGLPDTPPA
jgi:23S rRNA pseudouridine2605 synthase